MKKIWIFLPLLLIVTLLSVVIVGCDTDERAPANPDAEPPTIVTTIFPVADIVQTIGGDAVRVTNLIPSGASPHTFEPTPRQMTEMSKASAFIWIGAGLDDWAHTLAASGPPELVQLKLTDGLELLPFVESAVHHEETHEHQSYDPHIWLDPVLVREQVVPAIAGMLTGIVPEEEAQIMGNAKAYEAELETLHQEIKEMFEGLEEPRFVAFHSAWRYFAERYELVQAASIEEAPGKEPSARWIAEVVETARELDAKAIFAEPQFSNKTAEVIAREFGAQVLIVDPLGGAGMNGKNSYTALMRSNAQVFLQGLN